MGAWRRWTEVAVPARPRSLRRGAACLPVRGVNRAPPETTRHGAKPDNLKQKMKNLPTSLRWQINRLRCMTPLEIAHRGLRAARTALAGAVPAGAVPAPDLRQVGATWLAARVDVDPAPYLEAAARIAAGRLDILAVRDIEYGVAPRWNRHPLTGFEWPLEYGPGLSLKGGERGDIKYLWEPNRHLHLVTLAQAYRLGGDGAHAGLLLRLLDTWMAQCPPLRGPNWASAMEAALRLINWSLCWQLLGGAASPVFADAAGAALRRRWLESAYRHMLFVRRNLSLYSSANNHLIGELAGLFIAGRTWPYWRSARRWCEMARHRLARECLRQNAPDGVNREQAGAYHTFVLEYLMLAGLCARAGASGPAPGGLASADFPPAYWERLEAMCEFTQLLESFGPAAPAVGDSDDAAVVRLCPRESTNMRAPLLAVGARLFGRADFAAGAGDRAAWLFGTGSHAHAETPPAAAPTRPVRTDFPDGGYRALGIDPPARLRILFDTGPLGYTSIAAHGHADALAILLWAGTEPVLVDAGTYCYNDQPAWRAYFRGTGAHNTVRVDGLDQSEPGGSFMWLRKAVTTRLKDMASSDAQTARAEHDGYRRLPDPVTHERRLELARGGDRLQVADILRCAGSHEVEICWHFAEHLEIAREGRHLSARCAAGLLRIGVEQGAGAWHLYRGDEAGPWGWRSPRFGVKLPVTTAVWRADISGTCRFHTVFELARADDAI